MSKLNSWKLWDLILFLTNGANEWHGSPRRQNKKTSLHASQKKQNSPTIIQSVSYLSKLWPRRESNPYQAFRKRLFYPLNYGVNTIFHFFPYQTFRKRLSGGVPSGGAPLYPLHYGISKIFREFRKLFRKIKVRERHLKPIGINHKVLVLHQIKHFGTKLVQILLVLGRNKHNVVWFSCQIALL